MATSDRALTAARSSGNPRVIAAAARMVAITLRRAGKAAEAAQFLTRLTSADADAFFASTPTLTSLAGEPAGEDPALRDSFETLVGYAQRRFLDQSTAVVMAVGIERLLTTLLEIPADTLRTAWPRHDRATAAHAGSLLVDRDFSLRGRHHDWRLRADQGEQHART
ncbi:hypothetical protein [Streptomyces sp. NPDC088789]|uniref:hypothetical protein n=1 Tax=Streptomyces sp. NPDC088789 TaxID=3365899 RepID=UPI003809A522